MLYPRILTAAAVQVFLIGFTVSYFDIEVSIPIPSFSLRPEGEGDPPIIDGKLVKPRATKVIKVKTGKSKGRKGGSRASKSAAEPLPSPAVDNNPVPTSAKKNAPKNFVLTASELAHYDGRKKSKGLYLAILGRVFDVQKGSKHYGPSGGYHFFAGKDASRAFVSGDFTENGLTDNIDGLSHQDILGLREWFQFYQKDYKPIGYLHGTYYDSYGNPKQALHDFEDALDGAKEWQNSQNKEAERFPPCNSEWVQDKGGRVWCSNKSGGITRDWVGVPRKLFKPGSSQSRCACIKTNGPPQDADPKAPHKNKGDLDNPNIQLYDNCDVSAQSCPVPE